jgi:uncharacterized protein
LLTADNIISKYYINYVDDKKLQLSEKCESSNTLLKHEISSSCFLSYQDLVAPLTENKFSELTMDYLEGLGDIEILLIGTGIKHRFPDKKLYAQLHQLPYSIDFMDTSAACRTFNILVNENRKIGALIFLDS